MLESVGGATLDASLAATKRVTGRVVVYGLAGGEAAITNWDLVYKKSSAAGTALPASPAARWAVQRYGQAPTHRSRSTTGS